MFKWVFDSLGNCIPNWLYAAVFSKFYRYETGVRIFKIGKFLFRFLSGTSEIERLCRPDPQKVSSYIDYSNIEEERSDDDSEQTPLLDVKFIRVDPLTILLIDRSITVSTKLLIERRLIDSGIVTHEELTSLILKKKAFPNDCSVNSPEARILHASLGPIIKSRILEKEINELSQTKYDSSNKRHEQKLTELWENLVPEEALQSRKTAQWQKIGFQGRDPATDFRGMGILGLDNLHYFSKFYPSKAQEILARAGDPTSWYSFAIVGIQITSYTLELLHTRILQHQLFHHGVVQTTFHEIYCYLFIQFDLFWFSRPEKPTIMDFERLFVVFRQQIRYHLFRLEPLPLPHLENAKDI